MTNREQTKQFLQQVAQSMDGFWEIRFLNDNGPNGGSRYIETKANKPNQKQLESLVDEIHAMAKRKFTCFVSMNPRTVKGGTTKEETKQGRYIVADFDTPNLTLDDVKQSIVTRLTTGIEPTIIVETSPGHFQCWLLLSEAPASTDEWCELQKGLSGRVDSCRGVHGLAQPMRIPGVPNFKPQYQLEDGRRPIAGLVVINKNNIFDITELPKEEASASEKLQAADSSVEIAEKSYGNISRQFLDVENVANEDLSHGSRNTAMRFCASDMAARGHSAEEIHEQLLEAAEGRKMLEMYSKESLERQINNGIDEPAIEYSDDEICDYSDEEPEPQHSPPGDNQAELMPLPKVQPKPHKPNVALSHGLLGEIIDSIEPHTEADPAAVALQLLVFMGNMAGKNGFIGGGAKPLFMNINVLVIGDSCDGAKGESLGVVGQLTEGLDEVWGEDCQVYECNSGEGLKELFADQAEAEVSDDGVLTDPSIDEDKRRNIVLTEFMTLLVAKNRSDSSLSGAVCQLYDCIGQVQGNTRKNPFKGRNPYGSIIGHITPDDFEARTQAVDATSGFLNRFLACYSEESKRLPDGGDIAVLHSWHSELQKSLKYMQQPREYCRDDEAAAIWRPWYRARKNTEQGIVRPLTARARPHIAKLSLIMAALNRRPYITLQDLEAAFDLWRYSVETWRYQFGMWNRAMTDRVLAVLSAAAKPLTVEDITNGVGKTVKQHVLSDALQKLRQKHIISGHEKDGEIHYQLLSDKKLQFRHQIKTGF